MEETINIYLRLMQDINFLVNAESNLKQFIYNENFISNSFNILNSDKFELKLRIYVGAFLKNVVKNYYIDNPFFIKNSKFLSDFLCKSLIDNISNKKISNSICIIISELIKVDNLINNWQVKINEIIDFSIENEDDDIYIAIFEILNNILENTDDRTYVFAKDILLKLYEVFVNNENQTVRLLIWILVYQSFKKLSWIESTNKILLNSILKDSLSVWMGIFVSIISTPIKNLLSHKYYVIRILEEIFREFKLITKDYIFNILPVVWKNLNDIYKLYVWQNCLNKDINGLNKNLEVQNFNLEFTEENWNEGYELNENFNLVNIIQGISIGIIDLFNVLILDSRMKEILNFFSLSLLNILSHFLIISNEEIIFWEEDPNQYISNEEDLYNMSSIKQSAINAIDNIIEVNFNFTLDMLLKIINWWLNFDGEPSLLQQIKEYEVEINKKFGNNSFCTFTGASFYFVNNNDYLIKKREVSLLLMGNFSEDIISYYIENGNDNFNNILIKEVNNLLENSKNNFITGRILWVISKLYKNNIEDLGLFMKLYKNVTNFLNSSNPLTVRLAASKTTTILSFKISKNNLQNNIKTLNIDYFSLFNSICELFFMVDNNTIHIVLDNFILFIDVYNDLYSVAKNYIPKIFESFYKNYNDVFVGKIMVELFKKFINNNESLESFILYFIPIFNDFINKFNLLILKKGADNFYCNDDNESDFVYHLLDLIIEILKKIKNIEFDYNLIKNSINLCNSLVINSKDPSIIIKISIIIKNTIWYFNKKDTDLRKWGQNLIIRLINPSEDSSNCSYLGNLLMIYMEIYGFNIELFNSIITKLNKSTLPSINQGICVMFSKLLLKDIYQIINYLYSLKVSTKSGIKILINHWVLHQPKFIGKNTKNLTFYALYKIFILHEDRIDNMLTINYNPSHSNKNDIPVPLKILSLLINGLENEINSKKAMKNNNDKEEFNYNEGRLETMNEEEEDYNYDDNNNDDNYMNIDVKLDRDEIHENNNFEDMDDFKSKNSRKRGLAGMESGSQSYMSGMLGYDLMDSDECDETTEDDILYFFPNDFNIDTIDFLKNWFNDLMKNDLKFTNYFNLLPDDLKDKFKEIYNNN